MSKTLATGDAQHGVAEATYSLSVADMEPTIICHCNEAFSAATWEEVGALFDDHLREEGA